MFMEQCMNGLHCWWLACTLQITKEAGTAHVVLATSEYGFINWLKSGELLASQLGCSRVI